LALEAESITPPSRSWLPKFITRLIRKEFRIRTAEPFEQDRYRLIPDDIAEHFRQLSSLPISDYDSHLVVNLDETGFGASKSGLSKSAKVVVPVSFQGKPVREKVSESHFVSVLAAITLAGDVLSLGFITKRSTDQPDASKTSYFQYVSRYSSEKAFVTRAISSDYLRMVVLPFIERMRSELGNPRSPAMVIFDVYKAHMLEVISAFTAEHGITLFLLPPHSSHLLQLLDQGFFSRVKVQFEQFQRIKELSKVTSSWRCREASSPDLFGIHGVMPGSFR
jgi:hypothetical protein